MTIYDFCLTNRIACKEWGSYYEIRHDSDSVLCIEKNATIKQFLTLIKDLQENYSLSYSKDDEAEYWFSTNSSRDRFNEFLESNRHILLKEKAKERLKKHKNTLNHRLPAQKISAH
jgi:hypothetical protein